MSYFDDVQDRPPQPLHNCSKRPRSRVGTLDALVAALVKMDAARCASSASA